MPPTWLFVWVAGCRDDGTKSLSIDKLLVPKNPKVYQLINFWSFGAKTLSIDKVLGPKVYQLINFRCLKHKKFIN